VPAEFPFGKDPNDTLHLILPLASELAAPGVAAGGASTGIKRKVRAVVLLEENLLSRTPLIRK
jgi:hypothetical protein